MRFSLLSVLLCFATLLVDVAHAAEMPETSKPVEVEILALNDLHGHLLASPFYTALADGSRKMIPAGGIAALGTLVRQERARNPSLIFVGNGDLVGASPLSSGLLHDEPTIDALNQLGLEFSALGNHELDQGRDELRRMQSGGCPPDKSLRACIYQPDYHGAQFHWLAANVIDTATHQPLLPAYAIREVHGVQIAFIGAVLKSTPLIVEPDGVTGLQFEDEAMAINRTVAQLRKQGIKVFVALIHQGGDTPQRFDEADCTTLTGDIVGIVRRLDPDVHTVISGHTHRGYQCRIGQRLVTQAEADGHLLTRITLTIDPATGKEITQHSVNLVVDPARLPPDRAMQAIVERAQALTEPMARQELARLAVAQVVRNGKMEPDTGEAPLGDLVADAYLFAAKAYGAQIAFLNRGNMRDDLPHALPNTQKAVNFGDAFAAQPFNNHLVVMTLTGAQIKAALEQQWVLNNSTAHMLQVSRGFAYAWDASLPLKTRVDAASITLHGRVLDPAQHYRVVMNDFLAAGGDGVTVFRDGTDRAIMPTLDLQALITYLQYKTANGTPAGNPAAADRIVRRN